MNSFFFFFHLFLNYWVIPVTLSILWCILRLVDEIWWKPKNLENQLMSRGIEGNSYRVLHGDTKENQTLMSQAWSKPMSLNHDIVPRVNPLWHQMVQKYGKISLTWHQRRPRLLVADAALVKHILMNKDGHFRKPPSNPLVDLLTLGVSTLEGNQWHRRRKLINPAFHNEKILGMLPAFITSCRNLIQEWKDKMAGCQGKLELEIAGEMQNLTSDVIARAAFGTTYEKAKTIFSLQKEQVGLVLQAFASLYFPGLRFLPTKNNRRMYGIDRQIKAMLNELILDKELEIQKGQKGDGDLLSLLCQKQRAHNMTMNDVMEECKLFYFAGQETTSNLLTWTMILLSMHPNWQDKAREEILQVFGTTIPDAKNIGQLKIVSMIFLEVLRLYPAVAGLFRYTLKTTQLDDLVIPSGVELILQILLLHHDPEYWGEDVEEFKPERFAGGVSSAGKYDNAYFPFGWGPRFCLGQNFAMVEAKVALSMILQNFWFELSPSYSHAPCTVITLQPQHGAPLLIHQFSCN